MKQQLLLLIFTLTISVVTAQSQASLTHKITEYFNDDTQEFSESVKEEYAYNDNGQLAESNYYYWISISWVPANKSEYTYNDDGFLKQNLFLNWNEVTKSYVNNRREVINYVDNKMMSQVVSKWVNGAWVNDEKTEFVYDGNNIASFTSYEWEETKWENDERGVVKYEGNKISEITIEEYENNVWEFDEKTIYVRNPSTTNIEDIIYQDWDNGAWQNDERINYNISPSGNRRIETYYESPDGISWVEENKIEYAYDETKLMSNYRNPFQVNLHLKNFGVDDEPHYNKILSSIISENENDTSGNPSWEVEGKTTYYYSDDTMGLDDLTNSNFVTVYPNPFKNSLNIQLKDQIKADASLFDVNGRLVLEQKIQTLNTTLSIEALNSGMYFLKIRTDDGFVTKRITKH